MIQAKLDHMYDGRPDSELTREQIIDRNLHVVEAHFHNENPETVDDAVALYGNTISWEAPSRGVVMDDRKDILEAYRGIFRTLQYERTTALRRFATEDFVFDDQIGEVKVVGEEMHNLPYKPGTRVNCRLVHLFELKDGKIIREIAYELWREADSPIAVDRVPEGAHVEVYGG
ncbi:nuclear transport factor 2 family protein [Streptomyces umbrinus]